MELGISHVPSLFLGKDADVHLWRGERSNNRLFRMLLSVQYQAEWVFDIVLLDKMAVKFHFDIIFKVLQHEMAREMEFKWLQTPNKFLIVKIYAH